eukprot:SAG22_NODE_16_length_32723_cov_26.404825_29_plen_144_part_00
MLGNEPDKGSTVVVGSLMMVICGCAAALLAEDFASSDLLAILGGVLGSVFFFFLLVVSRKRPSNPPILPPASHCRVSGRPRSETAARALFTLAPACCCRHSATLSSFSTPGRAGRPCWSASRRPAASGLQFTGSAQHQASCSQ